METEINQKLISPQLTTMQSNRSPVRNIDLTGAKTYYQESDDVLFQNSTQSYTNAYSLRQPKIIEPLQRQSIGPPLKKLMQSETYDDQVVGLAGASKRIDINSGSINPEISPPRFEDVDVNQRNFDRLLDYKKNTLKCALISKSDKQHEDMDLRVTQSIDDTATRHNFGLGKLLGIDSQVKSIDYSQVQTASQTTKNQQLQQIKFHNQLEPLKDRSVKRHRRGKTRDSMNRAAGFSQIPDRYYFNKRISQFTDRSPLHAISIAHHEDLMTEEDVAKMVSMSIDQDSSAHNTHAMPSLAATFNQQYPQRMLLEEKNEVVGEAFNIVRNSVNQPTRTKSLFKQANNKFLSRKLEAIDHFSYGADDGLAAHSVNISNIKTPSQNEQMKEYRQVSRKIQRHRLNPDNQRSLEETGVAPISMSIGLTNRTSNANEITANITLHDQGQNETATNITFSNNPSVEKNREYSRQRILENISHDPISSQMTSFRQQPNSISFKTKQDLKQIQQSMDKDEIQLQDQLDQLKEEEKQRERDKNQYIKNQSKGKFESNAFNPNESKLRNRSFDALVQRQNIYIKYLQDVTTLLQNSKEQHTVQQILQRIADGFKSSQGSYLKLFTTVLAENIQVKLKKDIELRMLTEEYNHYKSKNSLDEYFEKYLTNETRKNTLKLVDELLQEEDWMEKLRQYKNGLDRLNYSDTGNKLQEFYDDLMEAQTGRLAIYAEQTRQAEETIAESESQPPLPSAIYNQEFDKALDNKYNFGVYQTGRKVTERLYKRFVKPMASSSTQTESIQQLTAKYEAEISDLTTQMEVLRDECERAAAAASKSSQRARDLVQQKNRLTDELDKLREERDKNHSEYLELKSLQYNYKEQLLTAKRAQDSFKAKAEAAQQQLQDGLGSVNKLKTDLFQKNQMLNEVREDAKENAILKIKLNSKVQAQQAIIDKLSKQVNTLREKIKQHSPNLLDADDLADINLEVQSESVRASQLGGRYDATDVDDLPNALRQHGDNADGRPSAGSNLLSLPGKSGQTRKQRVPSPRGPKAGPSPSRNSASRNSGGGAAATRVDTADSLDPIEEQAKKPERKQLDGKKESSRKVDTAKRATDSKSPRPKDNKQPKEATGPAKKAEVKAEKKKKDHDVKPKEEKFKIPIARDNDQSESKSDDGNANQEDSMLKGPKVVKREASPPPQDKRDKASPFKPPSSKEDKRAKSPFKDRNLARASKLQGSRDTELTEEPNSAYPSREKMEMAPQFGDDAKQSPNIKAEVSSKSNLTAKKKTSEANRTRSQEKQSMQSRPISPLDKIQGTNDFTQTDPEAYIHFACNMFVVELQKAIDEENNLDDEGRFYELLDKAMHIINRIKSKCNTPYGMAGGAAFGVGQKLGPGVNANQPLTPRYKKLPEKSWHFDVSSPEKQRPGQKVTTPRTAKQYVRNTSRKKEQQTSDQKGATFGLQVNMNKAYDEHNNQNTDLYGTIQSKSGEDQAVVSNHTRNQDHPDYGSDTTKTKDVTRMSLIKDQKEELNYFAKRVANRFSVGGESNQNFALASFNVHSNIQPQSNDPSRMQSNHQGTNDRGLNVFQQNGLQNSMQTQTSNTYINRNAYTASMGQRYQQMGQHQTLQH